MYTPFELEIPRDLAGALDALGTGHDSATVPLAGGTNLIVDLRARREHPRRIVSLGEVAELRGMELGETRIAIGGGTTVSDLLQSAGIAQAAPSLIESARLFAGLMVRNTATVAGNIACGSPAADLVPPLLSLDADVTLASAARSPDRAARRVFPRLQARRPAPGRAHHPHRLAPPSRAVREHLLQARAPQGRCDHRHRSGGHDRGRRRHVHPSAHRPRRRRPRRASREGGRRPFSRDGP